MLRQTMIRWADALSLVEFAVGRGKQLLLLLQQLFLAETALIHLACFLLARLE